MNKDLVLLFDMDGTIADTDPMLFETFNILYDRYKGGQRKTNEEVYYFSGPPIRQTLSREFPDQDVEFMYKEFFEISRSFYPTHIFAYPNEREVLLELKKEGCRLGVVTNKQHNLAEYVLELLNLKDIFELCIGYDDVSKGKPDPEGILKAIDYFKTDKEHTIYVGDNEIDFKTANNAGVRCALVSDGPRLLDPNLKPFIKFKSYLELKEKIIYGKDL